MDMIQKIPNNPQITASFLRVFETDGSSYQAFTTNSSKKSASISFQNAGKNQKNNPPKRFPFPRKSTSRKNLRRDDQLFHSTVIGQTGSNLGPQGVEVNSRVLLIKFTLPETNSKSPWFHPLVSFVFYHQKGGCSMAMLVSGRVWISDFIQWICMMIKKKNAPIPSLRWRPVLKRSDILSMVQKSHSQPPEMYKSL